MLDARAAGAVVLNHAEMQSFVTDRDAIVGANVRDELSDRLIPVRAQVIANATGPWTDAIRRMEDPSAAAAVLGTKGVHIAVPAERVGDPACEVTRLFESA